MSLYDAEGKGEQGGAVEVQPLYHHGDVAQKHQGAHEVIWRNLKSNIW